MSTPSAPVDHQFALLRTRRFLPFFITGFLGALNDNVFKNALVIVLAYRGGSLLGLSGPILINLAAVVFILPYVFLSASAGQWSDKFQKPRLMRWVKLAEVAIMAIGVVGFIGSRVDLLFLTLLLMGCHSTIFGPAKYALMPQQLHPAELIGGNGLVELGTFAAILIGTVLGGGLVASHEVGVLPISLATLLIALAGYISARWIPDAPAADPGLRLNPNPLSETWRNLRSAARDRTMLLALLANSWFWFYGACFLTQFPSWTREFLGGDETVTTLLLAALSFGIGIGSLACERLSRRGLNLGLVPAGLAGMVLLAWLLPLTGPDLPLQTAAGVAAGYGKMGVAGAASAHGVVQARLLGVTAFLQGPGIDTLVMLIGMGVACGLYVVPLYALVQSRADPREVSRMIAANNVLNAVFMVVSSALAILMFANGATIPQVFQACALATLVFLGVLCWLAPEFPRALRAWWRPVTG